MSSGAVHVRGGPIQLSAAPLLTSDAHALLDALPDATALLDDAGTVIAVNNVWTMFTVDNNGREDRTGVGVNYLDVCARAAAAGCEDAGMVSDGLAAVLRGSAIESEFEYPCPSPAVGRWFKLRATAVAGARPGVLVSHVNITRRKQAEEDLVRKASHDPLTGLTNRAMFDQRVATALTARPGRAPEADVGILFMDLDGFKAINDTYGHAAGDELLQTVAVRLGLVTRPQDTVARLGGDEFAVVAPRVSRKDLEHIAGRMVSALAEPHLVHGRWLSVGGSVGTYLAAPGEDPSHAVGQADAAMYATKRARRPPALPAPAR